MSRATKELGSRPERERTIVLPESEPVRVRQTAAVPRDRGPWIVALAVGVVVLVVAGLFGLTLAEGEDPGRDDVPVVDDPASPAATIPAPTAAPNAELAIGTSDAFASTVLVGEGVDLLAALASGASTGHLVGAPVNADAARVGQVFGQDAFSVTDRRGQVELLVYVPGATDELEGFLPGTKVLFVGTLQAVPTDLGTFMGFGPAATAEQTGVYVVVVPETLVHITPPAA